MVRVIQVPILECIKHNMRFNTDEDMEIHFVTEHFATYCYICRIDFSHMYSLDVHMMREHMASINLDCD